MFWYWVDQIELGIKIWGDKKEKPVPIFELFMKHRNFSTSIEASFSLNDTCYCIPLRLKILFVLGACLHAHS